MKKTEKRKRTPYYKRGYREELLKMLLSIGGVSYRGLKLMEKDEELYKRKLRMMKEEGLVAIINVGKRKMARLNDFENTCEPYIQEYERGYFGHYLRNGFEIGRDIGRYNADNSKGEKACRTIESAMLLHAGGVNVFWERKADIREEISLKKEANYYLPREIKEADAFQFRVKEEEGVGDEKVVINTRTTGSVFSPGGDYVIYHTGDKAIKWSAIAEYQMMHCMGRVRRYHEKNEKGPVTACMVIGYKNEPFVKMINPVKRKGYNLINTEGKYENMYQIPYSKEGAMLVRIMTRVEWKEEMIKILIPDADTERYMGSVTCDGVIEDVRIFLFTSPDLVRLRKFLNAAAWDEPNKSRIYCFDFQLPFLESVTEGRADIMVVSFKEYCEAVGLTEAQ